MKLEAKDLRIGNLVYDETKNTTVVETIIPDHNRVRYGIPLTEERLLELGFEDIDNIKVFKKGKYDVEQLYTGSDEWEFCINGEQTGTVIKYVHQLQNLFYDLTHNELTKKD